MWLVGQSQTSTLGAENHKERRLVVDPEKEGSSHELSDGINQGTGLLLKFEVLPSLSRGFSCGASGKEPACQC